MTNDDFVDSLTNEDLEFFKDQLRFTKHVYEMSIDDLKIEIENAFEDGDIENENDTLWSEPCLYDFAQFVHNYSLIIMCDCIEELFNDDHDLTNEYEFNSYVIDTYGNDLSENLMTWSL